jgi:hypothetical protein
MVTFLPSTVALAAPRSDSASTGPAARAATAAAARKRVRIDSILLFPKSFLFHLTPGLVNMGPGRSSP